MAGPVEYLEFSADDRAAVTERMASVARDLSGWINMQPGLDPDVEPPPAKSALFGFLAASGPDIPLCTWLPRRPRSSGTGSVGVGIQHPAGPKVVRRLSDMGITVPPGWVVRQDHPRRGLVLDVPLHEEPGAVLDWLVRASTGLCALPLSGKWLAAVYRSV